MVVVVVVVVVVDVAVVVAVVAVVVVVVVEVVDVTAKVEANPTHLISEQMDFLNVPLPYQHSGRYTSSGWNTGSHFQLHC